jgi:hypothetical protein
MFYNSGGSPCCGAGSMPRYETCSEWQSPRPRRRGPARSPAPPYRETGAERPPDEAQEYLRCFLDEQAELIANLQRLLNAN